MEAPTKPPTSSLPSTNPPSVEVAYKRKCIALKKRLNEIESENELMRVRNRRGWKYIQKMRLESCILLDRLTKVTGMAEEAQAAGGVTPELRAKAAAMMSNAPTLEDESKPGAGASAVAGNGAPYLDDETEGSSEEAPPTPQDRPLRTKRRNRIATCKEDEGWDEDGMGPGHPTVWRSPKWRSPMPPAPKQEELTSSFRVQTGSNGGPASSRRPSVQDTQNGNGNGAADVPAAPADAPTTPMDMDIDTKEPKVEGQG
ncbi:uncharacterized protein EURHEDRAFT_384497 [Aspergillus ruber CBS 135680]|uniref:INO80 complex subunit F domain-containing protein n=1 Tax=Aspergillus ruber (strain CBS 135680) TaxID=1388766 RepID=A0A017SN44_ASPRC|nr:uncharacterized protein EURHEDRAFT_384497 [Aspergillus ruber CBS 135680]EYE97685.1 hypothetical protein EURHEDRAFT_384497 [Aspergillus ruber CBS 135680]